MVNGPALPRPRDIRLASWLIRANWTTTQRRERRLVAEARRQQLMRWVAEGGPNGQAADTRAATAGL